MINSLRSPIIAEYNKAIAFFEKALESDLKTYGPKHPSVATRWNNLGSAWEAIGDYNKAIEFYNKALAVYQEKLGEIHPYSSMMRHNIANAKLSKKKENAPFLGVGGEKHSQGCRITKVIPESPAEKANLMADDVITKINKISIANFDDFLATIATFFPGDTIAIELIRAGQTISKKVILARRLSQ